MIADQLLSWSDRIKYLGCFFKSRNCEIDIASFVARFYGTTLNVMGKSSCRNDMVAVHLIKSSCLPSMLYGCEIWSINRSDIRTLDIAWNNAFRKIFNALWRESVQESLANAKVARDSLARQKTDFDVKLALKVILGHLFCNQLQADKG